MTNPTATTCPKCHGAIEPGERFCRNCGTSLSGEQRARTTELDLLQQATLGDYEIIRLLGQGGMATVYLAQDLTLDRKVAIKVISPDVARGANGWTHDLLESRAVSIYGGTTEIQHGIVARQLLGLKA